MEALTRMNTGKILLVSTNTLESPYPVYPIGVAHLINVCRAKGHAVDHFDLLSSGDLNGLNSFLSSTDYDAVGISIRNIDTVDSKKPEGLLGHIREIISLVRRQSKAQIILGGPGFSIMPEQLMDYFHADYGIIGEGEEAFPELIDKIIHKQLPVKKLFSRHLDHYPSVQPYFSEAISEYYLKRGGMLNLQSKRGCSYGCTYCSYPTIEGKKTRYRQPNEVADEFKRLTEDNRAQYIFFTDGVFNDSTDHHLQVAEALIHSGNSTPWCAFFRPQNISKQDLRLLKRSGLSALELGTDASTDQTLKALQKGFSFDEVVSVNDVIVSEGLPCAHFIMFGGPEETEQTVSLGIKNIERLKKSVVFSYIGIRILPQTRLYRRALKENIIEEENDLIEPVFYYSPHVSRQYLEANLESAFKSDPTRIFGMDEMDQYVQLLHSMGHNGPLWDLLLKNRLRQ